MEAVVTIGSLPFFQWLQSISDQGLHRITIWGLFLGLIGGLYLTYDLLGRRHGPLRWVLRILSPMMVTIAATALLFIPVFVLLYLVAGNLGITIAIVIATFPRAIGAFHGAFASSLDATSKNKSINIEQLRVLGPNTTAIPPEDHDELLNTETQSISYASSNENSFHLKSKAGAFPRLKLRDRWQKFRKGLPNAGIGFIRGFLYTFAYWLIALTLVFGTQFFADVINISLIFALPLGGIAGFCWLGYIHPPARSRSSFWEFIQRIGTSIAWGFANIRNKPFRRFKDWATSEPTTIGDPPQKPKTAEDTGEEQILTKAPLRPAFFSIRDSKTGFKIWFLVTLLFSITLGMFIVVTNIKLSQPILDLPYIQELLNISNTPKFNPFIIIIFGSTTVLALVSGWFAGGITRFTYWWTSFSPGKLLGACGLVLALIGFGIQLIEPFAQITNVTSSVYIYHGHKDVVRAIAWSPDGSRIASGSWDKTVQVWDATTGQHILTYRGHTDVVNAVAWSPDGSRIASASDDGTVRIWDAHSGETLLVYHPSVYQDLFDVVNAVAWSPDGKHIASTIGNTVQVWDAHSGKTLLAYDQGSIFVYAVAWSPDGTRIASGAMTKRSRSVILRQGKRSSIQGMPIL